MTNPFLPSGDDPIEHDLSWRSWVVNEDDGATQPP